MFWFVCRYSSLSFTPIADFKVTRGEKQTFTTIPQESIIVSKEGLRNVTIREEGGANRMVPRRLTLPR